MNDATRPIIVSVSGPSNAGKSQLAKAVARHLGEHVACRIPTDYFLVPRLPGESILAFHARPLAWDWDLLDRRLDGAPGSVVTTPDFDFDAFVRRSADGGLPFTIRPVMLIDAISPYPAADLVVLIHCPEPERIDRVRARDARWGSSVAARWESMQATWDAAKASVQAADLALDGTAPPERNAAAVAAMIDMYMGKVKR